MAFVLVDANDVQVERHAVGDDGVGSDALIEVPGEWETAPNHGNPVRKVHMCESRKKGSHL
jgi:hypothetical protein